MTTARIAVIDDDESFSTLMRELLEDDGYEPVSWHSPQGAVAFLARETPDLLILDLWMGTPRAGLALLAELRDEPRFADLPVIVCSAYWDGLLRHQATLESLRCAILRKPFDMQALLDLIPALLASSRCT